MSNADDSSEDDHQSNPNQKITQKKEQDNQFSIKKATQNQTNVSQKKNLGDAHQLNPFSTSLTPFTENDKDLNTIMISSVNIHDENFNIIMRANFAQPITKTQKDEFIVRLKEDF